MKMKRAGGASTPIPALDQRTLEGGPAMPVEANISACAESASIQIQLTGCETATCGDLVVKKRNGPIGALARKLIDAGHEASELVSVRRGDVDCFKPYTLAHWTDLTTSETDASSVRHVKYAPLPDGAFGGAQ